MSRFWNILNFLDDRVFTFMWSTRRKDRESEQKLQQINFTASEAQATGKKIFKRKKSVIMPRSRDIQIGLS